MPVEDLAIALSVDLISSVPGLGGVAKVTLRDALAAVKLRLVELRTSARVADVADPRPPPPPPPHHHSHHRAAVNVGCIEWFCDFMRYCDRTR